MPHLVFFVHGMGAYPIDPANPTSPPWFTSWRTAIENAMHKFRAWPTGTKLSDFITPVPITYDTDFDEYWKHLSTDWRGLKDQVSALGGAGANIAKYIPDPRDLSDNEGKFFWTHIADVLLYLFSDFKKEIALKVASTIAREIATATAAATSPLRVSIVAHSMGCRVVHDALCILAADPATGAFRPENMPFSGLHTFANVSRLMALNGSSPYVSPVSVHTDGAPLTGFFATLTHYYHRYDPITLLRRYDAEAVNGTNVMLTRYDSRNIKALKDIHAFETYMTDPDAYIPLLEHLINPNGVEWSEDIAVHQAFLETTKELTAANLIGSGIDGSLREGPDETMLAALSAYALAALKARIPV